MLADTVVNVIVRRNLSDAEKKRSAKWRRAVATVDWLATQMPGDSHFQIYGFAESAGPVLSGTRGEWLEAADREQMSQAMDALGQVVPEGGTNLEAAFRTIAGLRPGPDNVLLITDGLPTQGSRKSRKGTVSGRERLRLFDRAVDALPRGVPVNVVLFPMEGDPMASSAFWKLSLATRGAFLSPPEDWP
ncbi:MAG: VWA domain-containing protein [Holophagales bacterium]|nr:VWA domain-containing protein [Holophagales bacterium]